MITNQNLGRQYKYGNIKKTITTTKAEIVDMQKLPKGRAAETEQIYRKHSKSTLKLDGNS